MNFDENQWYHIEINEDDTNALAGTYLVFGDPRYGPENTTVGSVFLSSNQKENNQPTQKWQVIPWDSDYYLLRTAAGGPEGFMSTYYDANRVNLTGSTLARMVRQNVSDSSIYWKISPWGDGTYYFTNKANGSAWHLAIGGNRDSDDGTEARMSSNVAKIQAKQRMTFEALGPINEDKWDRSAITVAAANDTDSSPNATQSSSPSSTSTSNSSNGSNTSGLSGSDTDSSNDLSTGAKAGIGAGVGVAAVIAFALLGLFFFRRRKTRQPKVSELTDTDTYHNNAYHDDSMVKYGHYADGQKPELDTQAQRQELPSEQSMPTELPAEPLPRKELPSGVKNR